jgi:hypothetical protein
LDSKPIVVCQPKSENLVQEPVSSITQRVAERIDRNSDSARINHDHINAYRDQIEAPTNSETAALRLLEENVEKSRSWEQFVGIVSKTANPALVSLLRNSVILALDPERLVIGYHNLSVFTEEKKHQIEVAASTFFGPRLRVSYQEGDIGLATSLQKKQDQERKAAAALRKEQARSDAGVQALLAVFPDCEIREIIIEDETL